MTLDIAAYKVADEWMPGEWVSLDKNQAIQGCLISGVCLPLSRTEGPGSCPKDSMMADIRPP